MLKEGESIHNTDNNILGRGFVKSKLLPSLAIVTLLLFNCGCWLVLDITNKQSFGSQSSESDTGPGGGTAPRVWSAKVTLNNNNEFTALLRVTASIEAEGATQYSASWGLASCLVSSDWNSYEASKEIDLPSPNSENTFCVKFRDSNDARSDCLCDTIVHDSLTPSPPNDIDIEWTSAPDLSRTPDLNFSQSSDRGPSGISKYQLRVVNADTRAVVVDWIDVSAGAGLTGLSGLQSQTSSELAEKIKLFRLGNSLGDDLVYYSSVTNKLYRHRSLGGQKFGGEEVIYSGIIYRKPMAGDLDQDGDLDLIIFNGWLQNLDGVGTLAAYGTLDDFDYGIKSLGDMDGDGDLDLLGHNETVFNHEFGWKENTGIANFSTSPFHTIYTLPFGQDAVAINPMDLNGDQKLDVAMTQGDPAKLLWRLNQGGGLFNSSDSMIQDIKQMTLSDVDGDGKGDLIIAADNGLNISLFKGKNFQPPRLLSINGYTVVGAGDVDGDGDQDIVLGTSSTIGWLKNLDGKGSFSALNSVATGLNTLTQIEVIDFDQDGGMDILAVIAGNNQLAWYHNLGGGLFSSKLVLATTPATVTRSAVGDLDGDGDLDVAAWIDFSSGWDRISWYRFDSANLTFGGAVQNLNVNYTDQMIFVDVDNDGDQDLLTLSFGRVYLFLNTGGSLNASSTVVDYGNGASDFNAADYNGDGFVDIIGSFPNQGKTLVFTNNGNGSFATVPRVLFANMLGEEVQSILIGDQDLDGDGDIILNFRGGNGILYIQNPN